MAVLPIVTGEDKEILRTKTQNVPKVTKEILDLIKDMEKTTIKADGLGLAAPQIGKSLRLCLARINNKFIALINPEILWKGEETEVAEEGCLSLPDISVDVERAKDIVVQYIDVQGDTQERKLSSLEARIVQHEVDHLDGILIVDYKKQSAGRV